MKKLLLLLLLVAFVGSPLAAESQIARPAVTGKTIISVAKHLKKKHHRKRRHRRIIRRHHRRHVPLRHK